MKPLMNLINVATGTIIYLYLLDRFPKHLQIILIDICNHQITLSLTEVVRLPGCLLLLMHIRVMAPGMVVLEVPPTHPIISLPSLSVLVHHIPCRGQCLLIR